MTAADFPDPVYDVTCSCGATFEGAATVRLDDSAVTFNQESTAHSWDSRPWSAHLITTDAFDDAARLREMRAARRPAATDSDEQPAASVPGWAERHSGSQGGER